MRRIVFSVGLLISIATASFAEETASPPACVMAKPGKLLFRDDLKAQPDKRDWRYGPGTWTIAEGVLKGTEKAADKHGAVLRRPQKFRDAIIRYDFKLDGAKATTLSINDAKEHVCRVLLRPGAMTVRKDDHDHDGPDKAVEFETKQVPLKAGVWHTLVVEVQGAEMVATLDGQHTAFGSHELLNCEKANFGFTIAGEAVSFRNVQVWEALPNSNWPAKKAELEKSRAAAPSKATPNKKS
ncbi:MAG: Uncharacterized protein FD138_2330 [Planctomycetota bacterium]|nr:MAG: Uncharacterized protein FD138_2330 [Planctomycetota bacterium]